MPRKLIGKFYDKSDDTFKVETENDVIVINWRDSRRSLETQILLFPEDAHKLAKLLSKAGK